MTPLSPPATGSQSTGLRHVFYPYEGQDQYLPGIVSYVEMARADDATVLVCAPEPRSHVLRQALPDDGTVCFLDPTALGRNPGLLIGAWQDWIGERTREGRAVCGLSEYQWTGRTSAQLSEMRYREWLLNLAFAQAPTWSLLCPYDTADQSPQDVLAIARSHPLLWDGAGFAPGRDYVEGPYEFDPLSEPPEAVEEMPYTISELALLRHTVATRAAALGLSPERVRDFVVAVSEVASNSIRHGGGRGVLRAWAGCGYLVCELTDSGYICDPLAGRLRPTGDQMGGRGLWFAHQLCDLVQIRSTRSEGTRVRLHIELPDPKER
ncbi:sensor histidine kinase [Actinocrinis puniceicyclus]|uniref:Sensor histidine kinase n=1 Tax=Actinocrinis puniceicyclus TaxID=977794 RepID=A0A8J8BCB2_9ACTN|nr:sensor histidine kinase [Actinocrinis puniceicyclus]MBS2963355.1 sensor histidine kinase [Actinocrinis puniceicyclus]